MKKIYLVGSLLVMTVCSTVALMKSNAILPGKYQAKKLNASLGARTSWGESSTTCADTELGILNSTGIENRGIPRVISLQLAGC